MKGECRHNIHLQQTPPCQAAGRKALLPSPHNGMIPDLSEGYKNGKRRTGRRGENKEELLVAIGKAN